MGLFGLFKKNTSYFDKNIEPKCAYCEHGKPAKSEGKILCQRCGIVSDDFSCKKFSYSPFMRIPEKEHPPVYQPPSADSSEKASAVSAETNIKQSEIPAEIKLSSSDKPVNETLSENTVSEQQKTESPKKETPPESIVSDINIPPQDNSEKIRQLETVNKAFVSEIENHVPAKEIILPDVSEADISSIENTPVKRNSEDYLKNVSAAPVSEIESVRHTVHKLPDGTETATLKNLNNK